MMTKLMLYMTETVDKPLATFPLLKTLVSILQFVSITLLKHFSPSLPKLKSE